MGRVLPNSAHQRRGLGNDQVSIQSNTRPDLGHHMGKWQKQKKTSFTRGPRGQPFPSRYNKATMNRQDILAHRIRISDILYWDNKSYLTHTILPRTSREEHILLVLNRQLTSLLC